MHGRNERYTPTHLLFCFIIGRVYSIGRSVHRYIGIGFFPLTPKSGPLLGEFWEKQKKRVLMERSGKAKAHLLLVPPAESYDSCRYRGFRKMPNNNSSSSASNLPKTYYIFVDSYAHYFFSLLPSLYIYFDYSHHTNICHHT